MTPMTSGADLFVVCKQCGSEVSPYITECPYCGNRLRRRAPKLPRPGEKVVESPRRAGLGKLLGGTRGTRTEARGTRRAALTSTSRWASTRPYATIALVASACAIYVIVAAEPAVYVKAGILGQVEGDWWKVLTYQFVYFPGHTGVYTLVAVGAVGLFGWLVEQRHGPGAVVMIFLGAGVSGALVALAVYPLPLISGANAGALGLLGAWAVPDLMALRAGDYYEGDLLGTGAFAVLLLLLPFAATPATSWLTGAVGGIVGLVIGYALNGAWGSRASSDL
jgi:hypothetical protein